MKIEFTGRQTQVPDTLRRLAERKLEKVARILPGLTRAHVVLVSEKHRQIAEVSAHSRGLDLSAVESSPNQRVSLTSAIDKLLRQARRQREKRIARKGADSPRRGVGAGKEPSRPGPDGAEPRVIRSRRAAVKPMTLEEAALFLDRRRSEGVLVYRDAVTERVQVLYRRKDGNLGLIEPEA
jgi:ribosome hibernation promoting factor